MIVLTNISILGCGWLGLPLAKNLIENQFKVKGSTTSESKTGTLRSNNITPFLITLNENEVQGNIDDFLKDTTILLIDIPPKLRGSSSENFVKKIKTLLPYIEKSSVEKVLFISSTSVYKDENKTVTEETIPKPNTESGKQLLEVEKLLLSNFKTTVLRFGGLIGEDRHPIYYLAGKTNLENPDAPINLIYQEDCIDIILNLIQKDIWNEIFNVVMPFHPNRKTYYSQKAKILGLEIPVFNESIPSLGKTVSSEKLIRLLDYEFKKME